ncbi:hypothetical protein Molly5_161 [Maribacter phage Molly_5]|uniref:Uncharacterized protein n=1 Tax=Maribacter phage Molly_1 TaxID=2745685 RepID=A0A8E4XVD9_9CAUD|nr:hypothetical protein M1M29_gp161 [Maribacter phage Molly_1]QQO97657.1 hypothetical protein Molly2_161 [Maribacter phage Molly_2]QQO97857.1 hypothetical protein Molly3_161 [Maribacter phage Molly_3]QQO98057.1 hypothetical protein Molly4_161 [Maribacter phage Molly_4]QQO98257.1 hypothetical protein Molly5_161 [Maribacter phage Molly_5]QQO97457.1 hypothetical protein Molly1_161 [Maribacter phage Molly_1]
MKRTKYIILIIFSLLALTAMWVDGTKYSWWVLALPVCYYIFKIKFTDPDDNDLF